MTTLRVALLVSLCRTPFSLSPEAVSSEINTLVRRGQRRGTVSINGADFAVDLQDMVAMPTEQYAVPRSGLGFRVQGIGALS